MKLWELLLLAVIQGISEFLPISSDGHLVITEALLGHKTGNLALNVALHFGTLLSILVVYRKDILPTLRQPRLVAAIAVATVPVVVAGALLGDLFDIAQNYSLAAGLGLLLTAGLLFLTPRIDGGTKTLQQITLTDALIIGLFQAVAPLPGVSRSGSTIVAALLRGVNREAAANFSFYIAVPAVAGATLKILVLDHPQFTQSTAQLAIAIGVTFVVGVLALYSLLRIVAARKLIWFAWYVLILAAATILASLQGWI